MLRYYQHGETGRVVATENELAGEWYEIEQDQYEQALHPLSPANTVLQADNACTCGSNQTYYKNDTRHCVRCDRIRVAAKN